jgi:dimethylhistidine N-methyltransferase
MAVSNPGQIVAAEAQATAASLRFVELHDPRSDAFADDLAAGLTAVPASVAPKYLYDELGLRLFAAITELPEYTPTRQEAEIFRRERRAIATAVGEDVTLIDLGAGDGAKAAGWFDVLRPRQYVAVDIAAASLHAALSALHQRHPRIEMLGVGMDFAESLILPPQVRSRQRVFFYPGSSIGNFSPVQAQRFLRQARNAVYADGQLLIGIDLVKHPATLVQAYDDALGVTAAFNRNILLHANRLLQADFDLADWRHVALFNAAASRIEMHLEARRDLLVRWPGAERRFARGERIHTENSYKYTADDFAALLTAGGWSPQHHWLDASEGFAVFHCVA